ncbi:hypothetical protein PN36_28905 [Candidatus Thiomargarita nelsonii]|uniref:Type I restriction modification DNA specificity domain-containing protein n=1 Tax=Candidatus Thiomargarita nelsonii TaxID=1003181 RepID=A0A4E0QSD5_9GAMM|nr:hypothetical protein PN36_28905 [Candidatus Thiomargarita nelsonii]
MSIIKYKVYAEYKDSGVEWLGMMPEHWEIKKIKFFAKLNPSKAEIKKYRDDIDVTFLPMESIGEQGKLDITQEKKISNVSNGYTYLAENDVIIAKITPCFENGKGAIARDLKNGIAFATTEVIPLRCNHFKDVKFIYYLLSSSPFRKIAAGSMYGAGGQKRVADSFVANYKFSLPPMDERQEIANYLNNQTSKIDTLIKKQQELIAILKEKRQALISHAVTKGLNPDVEFKDSGVEWLGMVPVGWEVKRIKTVAKILRGKFSHRPRNDPSFYDGKFPFIQTGDVDRTGKYITKYKQTLNEKGYAVSKEFPKGTLTMTIAANIGDVAILDFSACFPDSIVGFVPQKWVFLDFLFYIFKAMKTEFLKEAPVNTQGNLNIDRIGSMLVVLPDFETQKSIVVFLELKIKKIDTLIKKSSEFIELLKERRTALISAAVTGQIDVRDWVQPKSVNQKT